MRQIACILALVLASCSPAKDKDSAATPPEVEPPPPQPSTIDWPAGLPVYDHIVIVVNENKDYREIIRQPGETLQPATPYINDVLRAEGALFTQSFGTEHLSQGNYYWLFSGANPGVGHLDQEAPAPFMTSNLASQLIASPDELSFRGYSEGLPAIGSMVWEDGSYARRHVPWTGFGNVPHGTESDTTHLRFVDFPSKDNYDQLPTVAFVVPDLNNDMHDPPDQPEVSVPQGDSWLRDNLDDYYQWAKTHNSLLIYTFDECNDRQLRVGLTNPFEEIPEGKSCLTTGLRDPADDKALEKACDWQNQIVTIFAGAHIIPGEYPEGAGITHVNVLRTIEAMYGLPKSGAQQENALEGGISDDYIITDVFETTP